MTPNEIQNTANVMEGSIRPISDGCKISIMTVTIYIFIRDLISVQFSLFFKWTIDNIQSYIIIEQVKR